MSYPRSRQGTVRMRPGQIAGAIVIAFGLFPLMAQAQEPGLPGGPGAVPAQEDAITPGGPPPLPPEVPVSPPPPLPSFYVGIGGQPIGPVTLPEIADMIDRGEVNERTLVWTEGMPDWAPARDVVGVADLFEGIAIDDVIEEDVVTEDAIFDPAAFMQGTWRSATPLEFDDLGQSTGSLEITYAADGRVTGGGTLHLPALNADITFEMEGSWRVHPIDETAFRLQIDAEMALSAPALEVSEVYEESGISMIEVLDRDHYREDDFATWQRVR